MNDTDRASVKNLRESRMTAVPSGSPSSGPAGLEEIDRSLEALSDEELDAVIERARRRAGTLGDEAVAAIIDEAVRAVRAQGRS